MCRPSCFASDRQWRAWQDAAMVCSSMSNSERGILRVHEYCADCTPEYQKRMIMQTRCAYPLTTFVAGKDGFVQGRR